MEMRNGSLGGRSEVAAAAQRSDTNVSAEPSRTGGPVTKARGFRLMPWFAVTSLICIVLTASISAYVLQRFIERNILERDATVSMQFIQSASRLADPAPYLHEGGKIVDRAQFGEFFENVIRMPEVLRANIYDRDQVTVWSSDPSLAGTRSSHNDELTAALAGELVIELNQRTEHDKLEYATLPEQTDWFLESYIPVRGDAGQVIGVAELYKNPDAILQTLRKSRWLVWVTSAAGSVLLYLALFGFVRRASDQIRRQEQALVESERMAAIGGMATSVAHNIRNPMASIRSSAELAAAEGGPESRGCFEDIAAQVDRVNRWVADLVAFSQTPTGDPVTTPLPRLVNECVADIRDQAEVRGVSIAVDIPATIARVPGEPRLLKQVIAEILANALHAMPHGGALDIRAEPSKSGVELWFRDTGVGVPADLLDRVFDPQFSRKPDGLGVGLPLARRILRASGGTIDLRSTEGEGTMVTLRFAPVDRRMNAHRTDH